MSEGMILYCSCHHNNTEKFLQFLPVVLIKKTMENGFLLILKRGN